MPRHEHPGEEFAKELKRILEGGEECDEDEIMEKHMGGWNQEEFEEHYSTCEQCMEAMNSLGDLGELPEDDPEDA